MTERQGAMLASLYAGLIFGVFWIPIRALEEAGFAGSWAAAAYTGAPVLLAAPIYLWQRGELRAANAFGLVGGILGGVAFGLYAIAFLYTEIVRAILLFYLMPVWGFLLGRMFLGEAMTGARWLALGLGFAGVAVILGPEGGWPVPHNLGDWAALSSGMVWAVASSMILVDRKVSVPVHTANFFLFSGLLGAGAAVLSGLPAPSGEIVAGVAWWFVPVTLLVTLPAGFATVYGPTRLNPGLVGLLFMAEVAVASVSAAILTDEPFGLREGIGVALVMAAGLLEPYREWRG